MNVLRFAWTSLAVVSLAAGCGGQTAGSGGNGGTTAAGNGGATATGGTTATGGASGTGGATGGAGAGAGGAMVIQPGNPGTTDVTFTVDTTKDQHAISPLIYGWNGTDTIADDGQTIARSGGNRWTAYNWENNASNAGSDYMFENDAYLTKSMTPGAADALTLDPVKAHGIAALITIPIVDYVSADESPAGDVRSSGSNYLMTRFKQNGPTKGSAFSTTPSTSDGFVYQDEFVNWVKTNYGGTNVIFSLDNEPDIWAATHAEVHPNPVTYAELVMRDTTYAAAVKAVWSTAQTAGFVSYGWSGYETLQSAPDSKANGEFLTYYLDQMKAAETTAGKRLVDYLDLHWYPETYVNDGYGGSTNSRIVDNTDGTALAAAARIACTRSLWDPNYVEGNWITDELGKKPIMLIPWLKAKIAAHYPGTKLSFSEYTFGGGHDISGGVAEADALGIFGREGLDMATSWNWPDSAGDNQYEIAALRAFRNYDGKGAHFGDTSVHAVTTDDARSSVYASVDSASGFITIVAINKTTAPLKAGIAITAPAVAGLSARTLTGSGPTLQISSTAPTVAAQNAFTYTMPAMSVSVLTQL
jgi:Glycoside hydrolase family 44